MKSILSDILRLFLGMLAFSGVTVLSIFLFTDTIPILHIQILKWFPLFTCLIGFSLAGIINRKTKLNRVPLLLLALLLFIPFKMIYFPFFLWVILFSSAILLLTRHELKRTIKIPLAIGMVLAFGFILFSEPLIIKNENFGIDREGNYYNARVLWDFTSPAPAQLHKEAFMNITGERVHLSDFEGKILYVNFWATWCGPCLYAKPYLENVKADYKDNPDLVFIDISLDTNEESWKKYLQKNSPKGIQLLSASPTKTMVNHLFSGIPSQIIVNSQGQFREIHSPILGVPFTLTDTISLNAHLTRPYKVFQRVTINGKDSTIRVR
jgi:thiol-disulfide isomerase/thioredoxin